MKTEIQADQNVHSKGYLYFKNIVTTTFEVNKFHVFSFVLSVRQGTRPILFRGEHHTVNVLTSGIKHSLS